MTTNRNDSRSSRGHTRNSRIRTTTWRSALAIALVGAAIASTGGCEILNSLDWSVSHNASGSQPNAAEKSPADGSN